MSNAFFTLMMCWGMVSATITEFSIFTRICGVVIMIVSFIALRIGEKKK